MYAYHQWFHQNIISQKEQSSIKNTLFRQVNILKHKENTIK